MSPIDAHCTMPAYYDHIKPVYDALPDDRKGHIYVPSNLRREVNGAHVRYNWPPSSDAPLIVAAAFDLNHGIRPKAMISHGAGQVYIGDGVDSPSYDGGPGREQVGLFLCPNESSVAKNLARYPRAHGAAIGCPKLDAWRNIPAPGDGTIGVTFHWPCAIVPEAGWAWPSWRDQIANLARRRRIIGHAHPRARQLLAEYWASIGVEAVWDAAEWIARCDTIVVDNSSIAYEAAAIGRGVVLLDDASWRPEVEHGLRFWSDIPGPHLHPAEGLDGLIAALDDTDRWAARRAQVTERVYGPVDGRASARAVEALLAWETR